MKWSRRRLGQIALSFAGAGISAWGNASFAGPPARIDPLLYPALARLAWLYPAEACRRVVTVVSPPALAEFRRTAIARVERNAASAAVEQQVDADRSVLHALLMDDFRGARTVQVCGYRLAETE